MVHCSSATSTFKSFWIVGRAMVTAERLARSRNIAVHLQMSPSVLLVASDSRMSLFQHTPQLECNRGFFGAACPAKTVFLPVDDPAWCCRVDAMYKRGFKTYQDRYLA